MFTAQLDEMLKKGLSQVKAGQGMELEDAFAKVKRTDHAIGQMQKTMHYISKVLLAPDVAMGWAD